MADKIRAPTPKLRRSGPADAQIQFESYLAYYDIGVERFQHPPSYGPGCDPVPSVAVIPEATWETTASGKFKLLEVDVLPLREGYSGVNAIEGPDVKERVALVHRMSRNELTSAYGQRATFSKKVTVHQLIGGVRVTL